MAIGELLAWDSAFFGVTIGRLARPVDSDEEMAMLRAWIAKNRVDCTYCLVGAADAESPGRLESMGARLVDIRITYTRNLLRTPLARQVASGVRRTTAADLASLEVLAASAHVDSRFFFDPRFDRERVRELYREWIRKSIAGSFATGAVTVDHRDRAAGYVTFSGPERCGAGMGEIGLVAVAEHARGEGHGTKLLHAALLELEEAGATMVRVVTQGRNLAAQRLYQRAGFTTDAVAMWLHLWTPAD